jgi:DNA-binding CsgD family transcriptional regulator
MLVSMAQTRALLRHPDRLSAAAIKLSDGVHVVGRDPTCNVVLLDPSVSRFHAELAVDGSTITLRDMDSRNGTYINGKRIRFSPVRAGQQLHFGRVPLQVEAAGDEENDRDSDPDTMSVSDVFDAISPEFDKLPLSAAERRVFNLILNGHPEKEMARRLEISRNTVHCHVRKIYRALHVSSRSELLARFVQRPSGSETTLGAPTSPGADLSK